MCPFQKYSLEVSHSKRMKELPSGSMASKLVVLGIPWDVDTEGLREYMSKFGSLDDCFVMKERSSGRSRGFGYVTFSSVEDAKNVLECEHVLGNRTLEVKIATPKEEMRTSGTKKATRIFVARIPQSVDESMFRRHFEAFGEITDLYMPKDPGSKGHRGIGFITFESAEHVDIIMQETHELDGTTVVVDRATPKDEDVRYPSNRVVQGGYGAYNAYITAATRYAALGAQTPYDPGSAYGRGYYGGFQGMGKKIFVGRLPQEATTDDLRHYFGRFGQIVDVYIPKDPKRSGHRGFGFVTFADDGVADRVARRSNEILGQEVAIDTAGPLESGSGGGYMESMEAYGACYPMRSYSRFCSSLDYDDEIVRQPRDGTKIPNETIMELFGSSIQTAPSSLWPSKLFIIVCYMFFNKSFSCSSMVMAPVEVADQEWIGGTNLTKAFCM